MDSRKHFPGLAGGMEEKVRVVITLEDEELLNAKLGGGTLVTVYHSSVRLYSNYFFQM